jgi:hypothetical protein
VNKNANTKQTAKDEISLIDFNTSYNQENDTVEDAKTRVLIKLYVLADKLIDLHTANMVIDELVRHAHGLSFIPGDQFIHII